jgi:autoinducer 2-degrading protein
MRPIFHLVLATAMMSIATIQSAPAQEDATAYLVTYIDTLPAAEGQSASLLKQLADASRKEAGNLRFEVLQRTTPSSQFLVLEAWKDKAAMDAHMAAASTKQVRDKLLPLLLAPIDDRTSIATSASPMQAARGAVYVATHVDVAPPMREKTLGVLKPFADVTRKDPGNVRFDVLQQTARTNHFTVVEAWTDQKSSDAHELTTHGKQYRSDLAPMIGALYDQRFYKPL